MKKNNKIRVIHHPGDHSPSQVYTLSKGYIIIIIITFLLSIGGLSLLFFKPYWVTHLWETSYRGRLKVENQMLTDSLAILSHRSQKSQKAIDSLNLLYQRVATLAGVPSGTQSLTKMQLDSLPTTEVQLYFHNWITTLRSLEKGLLAKKNLLSHFPSIYPSKSNHTISTHFESILDPFTGKAVPHLGIDFALPIGDTIIATGAGHVSKIAKDSHHGLAITLDHGLQTNSFYSHLGKSLVRQGQKIRRGQAIALSGNSGKSSGPHLHYEIRHKGKAINPTLFILSE